MEVKFGILRYREGSVWKIEGVSQVKRKEMERIWRKMRFEGILMMKPLLIQINRAMSNGWEDAKWLDFETVNFKEARQV